ncbi:hypothetical protein E2C01_070846 [Portunus trituberculatus]|uniref:Uncharacterized protein n=1 Tax=Portunus trituberculatus TaxID=210409 RepID=A0A5B7I3B2_PORTR|nr:hypothetical protein [Portunus trituberculatus]
MTVWCRSPCGTCW